MAPDQTDNIHWLDASMRQGIRTCGTNGEDVMLAVTCSRLAGITAKALIPLSYFNTSSRRPDELDEL